MKSDIPEDYAWISMADIFLGMMTVFMMCTVIYVGSYARVQKDAKTVIDTYHKTQDDVYNALRSEFQSGGDLDAWSGKIETGPLRVVFRNDGQVTDPLHDWKAFFDPGSAEINLEYRAMLSDFAPKFFKSIRPWHDSIERVNINGHTSSEYPGARNTKDAYFRNMELSQARAREVLSYIMGLSENDIGENIEWIKKCVSANGLSSAHTLPENGLEDRKASRRVEFVITFRSDSVLIRAEQFLGN